MSENKEKWVSSFMQLEREHETTDPGNSKGIYCLSCTNNFDPYHHKIILVGVTGNQSNELRCDEDIKELGSSQDESEDPLYTLDEESFGDSNSE